MDRGHGLVSLVFSWSLDDILNDYLYRDKVRQIPSTFLSGRHYLNSFTFPLLEETRTDLCSSIKMVSEAPACEMTCIDFAKDYNPPHDLFYKIDMKTIMDSDRKGDLYEPEPGDIIALNDKRPTCIDDLDKRGFSFLIALIRKVKQNPTDESVYTVEILASKPIEIELYMQKDGRYIYGFAVYLGNLTTNTRIWNVLNSEPDGPGMYIIKQLLQPNSAVGENCSRCFNNERYAIDTSNLGAVIRSLDLNNSQEEGVLSCLAGRECSHKNTVKLIWGPPGTGKTKTVGSLLFSLFRRKCRTLTCAPTNVAVLEVTSRFLRLVMEFLDYHTYGFGDIVLFGNKKRMSIDTRDDLFDIFLDYRAKILAECFAPKSGWKHHLELMISLLENPENQYRAYLRGVEKRDYGADGNDSLKEEMELLTTASQQTNQEKNGIYSQDPKICKQKEWKRIVNKTLSENRSFFKEKNRTKSDKQIKKDFLFRENRIERLSFLEFVKKELSSMWWKMRKFTVDMCTHMPTSFISLRVMKNLFECLDHLKVLVTVLSCDSITEDGFKLALTSTDVDRRVSCCTWQSKLGITRKECLKILKSLQNALTLPDFFDEYSIKSFCLQRARMIFCTASSSARLHVEGIDRLEMLVVDEAAQLKECESIIPLQLPGLRHVVLVGDEKQLPALVKSEISDKAGFGRSLFERLVLLGHGKNLLNIQYRMHPSISLFPNMEFYDKQILDSPNVKERSYEKHFLRGDMFKSYSFINVSFGQDELSEGNSRKNMVEVAVVSEIILDLFKESASRKQNVSVGVISPYKGQVIAMQDAFGRRFGSADNHFSVKVSTVDGFQGGEEDVIIISTVRYNCMGSVGFMSNFQRTNVSLTRARYCLWIVGNGETLMNSGSVWERLVLDAMARGCYHNADEDERLSYAIVTAVIELGQVCDLLNTNSLLFRQARWKVCFNHSFLTTMAGIKSTYVCKEICFLLTQLSSGWRQPHQEINIGIANDTCSQLLQLYKVNELLNLVWTIDIIEENLNYIQVLKIWDVLPLSEVSKVARDIDMSYRNYPIDILKFCRFKCSDGNFDIPATWLSGSNCPTNYDPPQADPMQFLCDQFSFFSLSDASRLP